MSRSANLPVPVGQAYESRRERVRSERARGREARPASAFAAHLYGQDGRLRGLRAGAPAIDAARAAYLDAEWSGDADRRLPVGLIARTKV
jgi:hypothetical protein